MHLYKYKIFRRLSTTKIPQEVVSNKNGTRQVFYRKTLTCCFLREQNRKASYTTFSLKKKIIVLSNFFEHIEILQTQWQNVYTPYFILNPKQNKKSLTKMLLKKPFNLKNKIGWAPLCFAAIFWNISMNCKRKSNIYIPFILSRNLDQTKK